MDWIRVTHCKVLWQAFMNTVLKSRFLFKVEHFWIDRPLFSQEGIDMI